VKPVGARYHVDFDNDYSKCSRTRGEREWRCSWESENAYGDPCCQACRFDFIDYDEDGMELVLRSRAECDTLAKKFGGAL
jgi:hypothetical protein